MASIGYCVVAVWHTDGSASANVAVGRCVACEREGVDREGEEEGAT